jgi:U3 small nucleolar RNA-associated protein 20
LKILSSFYKKELDESKELKELKELEELEELKELEKLEELEDTSENIEKVVSEEDDDDDKTKEENQVSKEDKSANEPSETKIQLTRTKSVKLLLAMLQTFGRFTNTRSLYREPEIHRIYLDLLSSKNSEIQKAALACLYTYKYKYILPYKEHLDNIVDEKNLKNELSRFQISVGEANETILLEEHRQDLMPIIMRILHAKMVQRVGMRTGGKSGGLVKRKTILR